MGFSPFPHAVPEKPSGYVVSVENVAALGAELGGIVRVFGSPAALVALVERCACGLGLAAVLAELALVERAARAGPALSLGGLGSAAVLAEFARVLRAARAFP